MIPLGAYSNMMSLVMITVNNYINLPTSHILFFFFFFEHIEYFPLF